MISYRSALRKKRCRSFTGRAGCHLKRTEVILSLTFGSRIVFDSDLVPLKTGLATMLGAGQFNLVNKDSSVLFT